jgi:PAS domain S-box-containing protein
MLQFDPEEVVHSLGDESVSSFMRFIHISGAYIRIQNIDKRLIFLNKTYLSFLGSGIRYDISQFFLDSIHSHDLNHYNELIDFSFNNQKPSSITFRLKRNNGFYGTIIEKGNPIYDKENKFIGFLYIGFDLTPFKKREEELLKSNENCLNTINFSPIGIIKLTPRGYFSEINSFFSEFSGYSADELMKKNILDVTASPFLDLVWNGFSELISYKKEKIQLEIQFTHKNGALIWGRFTCNVKSDDFSNPKYFSATIEDIHSSKILQLSLRESSEGFQIIFHRHTAIMMLVDLESGNILDVNLSAIKFYGYSEDLIIHMNISDLIVDSPIEIQNEIKRAEIEKRNYNIFKHKLSSGEVKTVEVHSSPITINDKILNFSIIHDITNRRFMDEKTMKLLQERNISLNLINIIIIKTVLDTIVFMNQYGLSELNYIESEIIGEKMNFLFDNKSLTNDIIEVGIPIWQSGDRYIFIEKLRTKSGQILNSKFNSIAINPDCITDGIVWMIESLD